MLHALDSDASPREIWWIFGARDHEEHPFADESRSLVRTLPLGKSYVCYSRPGPSRSAGRSTSMNQDTSPPASSKN